MGVKSARDFMPDFRTVEAMIERDKRDYWLRRYKERLADFARPGHGFEATGATASSPSLGWLGKAAGLTAEEIVEDAHALGRKDHDGDIRRSWETATLPPDLLGDEDRDGRRRPRSRAEAKEDTKRPGFVPRMVRAGGGEADFDAVRSLSPYWYPRTANPLVAQTTAFFRLYHPNDILHVATDADEGPTRARPVLNMRTAADWIYYIETGGTLPGSLIKPNPLTGELGATGEGKPSFGAKSCLASFPFLVVEFDEMPLAVQCAFWRGMLTSAGLGAKVAAIVCSGSKSIHGFMRLGCTALEEWEKERNALADLLCSACDSAFRADPAAMRAGQLARLPGVHRLKTGAMQELLYLNPRAIPAEVREGNAAAWAKSARITPPPPPRRLTDEEEAAIEEALRYVPA